VGGGGAIAPPLPPGSAAHASSNFFLKLDALTSKLLAFFWDKSNMNNQLELEMGILNKMVGIISSSNFSSVHQLLVMARA